MEGGNGHRARDPGLKLGQIPGPTWVHCPECDGAARSDADGVACLRCGYMTIQNREPYHNKWVRIRQEKPTCSHCGAPLPTDGLPASRMIDGELHVRVRCPACAKAEDYRATPWFPPRGHPDVPQVWMRRYLVAKVGGETLWVDNLAHLEMLEDYLGAKVRERGSVAGLTMMARLPAWMKSATMRPKIVKALALLRERAEKAGINE
jgi:hypothetical protein